MRSPERKAPTGGEPGRGEGMCAEVGCLAQEYTATVTRCTTCGGHWERPATMAWATRCPACFAWFRAYTGIRSAARALREGVSNA
jgi:hypothetical protein